jgi:hypothetical protein
MSDPYSDLAQKLRGPLAANFLSVEAMQLGGGGYRLPFVPRDALQPFTANNFVFIAPCARDLTVKQFNSFVVVSTTNNGSNYWTLTLYNSAGTAIASLNTSAIVAGANTMLTTTSISPASHGAASTIFFQIGVSKTGSPGSLYMAPEVYVI